MQANYNISKTQIGLMLSSNWVLEGKSVFKKKCQESSIFFLPLSFCFFQQIIDSLETKEIVSFALKKLPDPVNVDFQTFEVIIEKSSFPRYINPFKTR